MTALNSPDRTLARATIFAALIGLLGTAVGTFLGNRVGERRSGDEVQDLEDRLQQQENAVQALKNQIAERDEAIRMLKEEVTGAKPPPESFRASTRRAIVPSDVTDEPSGLNHRPQVPSAAQEIPIAVKRLAPVDLSLKKCEHWGGGLSCRLLLRNSGSAAANIALGDRSTFAYDEQGNEYRLEEATLGSQRWSAEQFGAIRLEPGIPMAASFHFTGVPESANRGPLRLVLAVVPISGPQAFFGPNPNWQSIVFEDVPFE